MSQSSKLGQGVQVTTDGLPGSIMGLNAGNTRVLLAVLATGAWMFVSSFLILLNKHLMTDLGFRYPMSVSGMGMVSSAILSYLCCRVFKIVDAKATITLEYWTRKILPVGFFMAITLWTGNEVYLYLSVAFIQMLKAFTPVITMLCLFMAGLEDPTRAMIMSVLLTAGGTALAAYGEVNLSLIGLAFMLASETGEALRLVMTQWLLTGLKFHPVEGLMYLAPACSLWLLAGASVLEFRKMAAENAVDIIYAHPLKFAAAAVMGFMVNGLAYTSIKLASSLTLKVLGTVKNTLLVVFSVVTLGEVVTGLQASGYVVSLAGFAWYNHIKMAQVYSQGTADKAATKPLAS
mmetsp:Transcript_10735/g.18672  ORF Transcript_10735/g.18672 Transcript_10735/m.18672 type:complete len:347 (-) Transcript_10735:641-1681(-)|eukprot:CAMPEP_0119113756 /NCGR_PEP_ID=MMETSP1180-20130426/45071_1 /TAXON_ID=3052 ORGANISM="Chlamydomonas cf sp, Strain CCMP681" /NCGR_SAMPLE_ID=MMETSP1180 /ASSEMBLY_ACC=CAM_ASM_000741 /LENGTH=346 /DNA_ID=CAMNT_0007101991 /DNA_START=53 /DNA_END=1093 /DNA_ORIENTATION=+